MILYKFNKIGPPYWLMIEWVEENAENYTFTDDRSGMRTGVWLHEEDAIAFRLKFSLYNNFV